jgi:subtilisin family serine protease
LKIRIELQGGNVKKLILVMMRTCLVLLTLLLGAAAAEVGLSEKAGPEVVPGSLIIKYKAHVQPEAKKDKAKKHGLERKKEFPKFGMESVKVDPARTAEVMKRLQADPDVEYVEPNYRVKAQAAPNDTYYSTLWGMEKIAAPTAWNRTTGSQSVVVAVIDTGIDYTHPDLTANLWVNPSPGYDSDHDGTIDVTNDLYGYNAIANDGSPADPRDMNGHGSHVAGTIGAVGNNGVGVAGVNWNVRIMACRFLDASGSGSDADAIDCMQYISDQKDRGVNIIATNNSWGGGGYSQALFDAIEYHQDQGILFIAAAGNSSNDNAIFPFYPAGYSLPNVISVAATDSADALAGFSNYGKTNVMVAGPGVDIVSARGNNTVMCNHGTLVPANDPNAQYCAVSGTSMATPHVVGLAALLKADNTSRDWKTIRNLILAGGDDMAGLRDITVTGKRINANGSLTCLNKNVLAILEPISVYQTIGTPLNVRVLSINCGVALGPVTLQVSDGANVTLRDDGVAPDAAAGDGIFSGIWTNTGGIKTLTAISPAGTVTRSYAPPLVLSPSYLEQTITQGTYYTYAMSVTGGFPPYTWNYYQNLYPFPAGLRFDQTTGVISGTPTEVRPSFCSVSVADSQSSATSSLVFGIHNPDFVETSPIQACPNDLTNDPFYLTSEAAMDGAGNTYINGFALYPNGDQGTFIRKVDPSGNELWSKTVTPGFISSTSHPKGGMVVTSTGGVAIPVNRSSGFDLIAYDSAGNISWTVNSATLPSAARALEIAKDGSGNIYVTALDAAGNAAVLKFSTGGAFLQSFPVPAGQPVELAVLPGGTPIVLVVDTSTAALSASALTAGGAPLWTAPMANMPQYVEFNENDYLVVDALSNFYVAVFDGIGFMPTLMKYDSTGSWLWTKTTRYTTSNPNWTWPTGLAVNADGNIYLQSDKELTVFDQNGNVVAKDARILQQTISLAVSGNRIVTATMDNKLINVNRAPSYTVTPTAGAGGSISPSTPQQVPSGQTVAFTVTPNAGYRISSVVGCGGTLNGAIYTTAAITSNCTITATFTNLTLSPASCPPATVGTYYSCQFTPSGGTPPYTWFASGSYTQGLGMVNDGVQQVRGTPTSTTGSAFSLTVTDKAGVSLKQDYTISVNNAFTVTPTAGPNGSISPATSQSIVSGQTTSFTITPSTGYRISSVIGCGGTLNGSKYTTGPIISNCTVTATFAINTYTVTPTAGSNGSINPSSPQTVNYNQTKTFTVTPNTGYRISAVTGCNGILSGSTYTTGPITANCTVTATFVSSGGYTMSVTKAGTGSGTVTSSPSGISCGTTCSASFSSGTAVTLSASKSSDSLFAGWSGGVCSGTGTCTTTMSANKVVTATFTKYINVTAPNGGETWTRGSAYTIRWNYAGSPGSSVKIELLKGGSLNRTITSSTSVGSSGSGSYTWTVPSSQATGSDYTIRVTSTSNSNYKDSSNSNFTIQ